MKKLLILILLISSISEIKAQKSLYTQDTLAVNAVFRQRVKSATVNAANQIAADTSQPSYLLQYANQIITNPDGGWISGMTYQVVANPAISYESSDGDIQFTVNSNMDKCARAFLNILPANPANQLGITNPNMPNTIQWPLVLTNEGIPLNIMHPIR